MSERMHDRRLLSRRFIESGLIHNGISLADLKAVQEHDAAQREYIESLETDLRERREAERCPDCKGVGRISQIPQLTAAEDCPKCGGTGKSTAFDPRWLDLNRERGELINKSVDYCLSSEEKLRLEFLQGYAEGHIALAAPPDESKLQELENMSGTGKSSEAQLAWDLKEARFNLDSWKFAVDFLLAEREPMAKQVATLRAELAAAKDAKHECLKIATLMRDERNTAIERADSLQAQLNAKDVIACRAAEFIQGLGYNEHVLLTRENGMRLRDEARATILDRRGIERCPGT